jgi:hypothetical protein
MATAPTPFDGTSGYLDQLKSQLFNLDPTLAGYRTQQPSQDEYDQALEPVAKGALNVGLNAASFATANPLLAAGGIAASIANSLGIGNIPGTGNPDVVGGTPAGSLESGMNSLPISTLIKMAQKDTDTALAGPTINDVINARNNVFHATGNTGGQGILNSGQIKPGTGDQFTGVATSRVPVIPEKARQLRFSIDPDQMGPSSPTADSGYGKTAPINMPSYNEIFGSLTDKQFSKIKQETSDKYPEYDFSDIKTPKDLQKTNLTNKMLFSDTKTYVDAGNRLKGGIPNPDYEFETRTKGQSIDVSKAITHAIISTPSDSRFDTDPMEVYKILMDSKNPVPAQLVQRGQLPLYRVLAQKWLSQQVTGQGQ